MARWHQASFVLRIQPTSRFAVASAHQQLQNRMQQHNFTSTPDLAKLPSESPQCGSDNHPLQRKALAQGTEKSTSMRPGHLARLVYLRAQAVRFSPLAEAPLVEVNHPWQLQNGEKPLGGPGLVTTWTLMSLLSNCTFICRCTCWAYSEYLSTLDAAERAHCAG